METININIAVFALIGGFLPALFWLIFWLREDRKKPEPARLIARTFVFGSAAVLIAFIIQHLTVIFLESTTNWNFNLDFPERSLTFFITSLPVLISWSFIEELIKYLAASLAAFYNKNFDEPIDAMIYIITAAIGFAAIENTLFLLNSIWLNQSGIFFLLTGNLRFLGATVVHIVSSAIVGGLVAITFCSSIYKKILGLLFGLVIATILHAIFNFFIITSNGQDMFLIFLILWFSAIGVIYFFERVKKIVCLYEINNK